MAVQLMDAAAFFDHLRARPMMGPVLSADEVSGCERLLAACGAAGWGVAWTAYALATAWHETAHSMQPVRERGGPAYFRRMYDIEGARPKKARELGNLTPGDGERFCGRGYVQLTGRANYATLGKLIGVDLVGHPDRAMDPDIAAKITVMGMGRGLFTGRRLGDVLPAGRDATRAEFVAARRIINGRDCDAQIAAYALDFQAALRAGLWG